MAAQSIHTRAIPWENGEIYETYAGRWSRKVAVELLKWLAVKPEAAWLDVGCGSGALTHTILQVARPASVKAVDLSKNFVVYCQEHIIDPRASFEVGDALALPVESGSFDAVVTGLMLNFVPQPEQALLEMKRAARPGGVVAAHVWDYSGRMQLIRLFWNAAVAVDPTAYDLDEGNRFPICKPDRLVELFSKAGLSEVQVQSIDIWTEFTNFDDLWAPFLGGQGPAPAYCNSLDTRRRNALRERLRSSLPVALDGSIPLMARAWAVRGTN